jgi:hypothetical protein
MERVAFGVSFQIVMVQLPGAPFGCRYRRKFLMYLLNNVPQSDPLGMTEIEIVDLLDRADFLFRVVVELSDVTYCEGCMGIWTMP